MSFRQCPHLFVAACVSCLFSPLFCLLSVLSPVLLHFSRVLFSVCCFRVLVPHYSFSLFCSWFALVLCGSFLFVCLKFSSCVLHSTSCLVCCAARSVLDVFCCARCGSCFVRCVMCLCVVICDERMGFVVRFLGFLCFQVSILPVFFGRGVALCVWWLTFHISWWLCASPSSRCLVFILEASVFSVFLGPE